MSPCNSFLVKPSTTKTLYAPLCIQILYFQALYFIIPSFHARNNSAYNRLYPSPLLNRSSVVDIVTRLRAGRSGVRTPGGVRDFSLLVMSSYSMDTWVLFHLSPSSAEDKNEWSHTSAPLHAFMASTGKTLPLYPLLKF